MQSPTPQAPAAPAPAPVVVVPPAPTPPPGPGGFGPAQYTVFQVPQTAEQVAVLQTQRARISDQIENVRDQRQTIARQYERSSGASRAGLEQQLKSIDSRLLVLQQDLEASGRALYQARVGTPTVGMPRPFANLSSGQTTAVSIVFIACVLGPFAMSVARLMWRRSARPALPPGWNDAAHRLERLEQAVDTIAVEMERVSEGQRFMTKIMTQAAPGANANGAQSSAVNGGQPLPALGAGSPEPLVHQQQRDEVRIRRS